MISSCISHGWKTILSTRIMSSNQNLSKSIYLRSVTWGGVARSPEPNAHVSNARAFRIELEFRSVGFQERGKPDYTKKKPLGAEKRTNNKLSCQFHSNCALIHNKLSCQFHSITWFRELTEEMTTIQKHENILICNDIYPYHNYIKILESDWSSAALIWALIGQLHMSCTCNWTVVQVIPE